MTGTTRRVTLAAAVATLMTVFAVSPDAAPRQDSPVIPYRAGPVAAPIFNGVDLTGWKAEFTKTDVREGVLHVGSGNRVGQDRARLRRFRPAAGRAAGRQGRGRNLRTGVADLRQRVDSK